MIPAISMLVATPGNPVPPGARVETIATGDGARLRVAFWPASGAGRKGTVLLVPGRTEFIEKHLETVADLLARGFAVATFDWRGQGGSDRIVPEKCHVESFDDYDRDLDAVMRRVVLPDGPAPLFALAHSMGALVCLRAAAAGRARFERMVLTAPMVGLSRQSTPPLWLTRAALWLRLFLGGDMRTTANRSLKARDKVEPEPRQLRIAAVLDAAPHLKTGRPTARWVYSALRAIRQAERPAFAAAVKSPTLAVIAGRDRVVDNDSIERLTGDLRFGAQLLIPGARHEMLLELDPVREEFWAAFDAFVPGADPYA